MDLFIPLFQKIQPLKVAFFYLFRAILPTPTLFETALHHLNSIVIWLNNLCLYFFNQQFRLLKWYREFDQCNLLVKTCTWEYHCWMVYECWSLFLLGLLFYLPNIEFDHWVTGFFSSWVHFLWIHSVYLFPWVLKYLIIC